MTNKKFIKALICVMILTVASGSSCGIIGRGSSAEKEKNTQTIDNILSNAEAKDIVLSRVAGASAEEFTRFEKDLDDGYWIYEGELLHRGIEYEFEIDAGNGNILKWEIEN